MQLMRYSVRDDTGYPVCTSSSATLWTPPSRPGRRRSPSLKESSTLYTDCRQPRLSLCRHCSIINIKDDTSVPVVRVSGEDAHSALVCHARPVNNLSSSSSLSIITVAKGLILCAIRSVCRTACDSALDLASTRRCNCCAFSAALLALGREESCSCWVTFQSRTTAEGGSS